MLEGLFAADIVSWSDGGGVVRAARSAVTGRGRVARFIVAVSPRFWDGVTLKTIEANGRAAVLVTREGAVASLLTFAASAEGIDQILWMLRPSKLAAISGRKAP